VATSPERTGEAPRRKPRIRRTLSHTPPCAHVFRVEFLCSGDLLGNSLADAVGGFACDQTSPGGPRTPVSIALSAAGMAGPKSRPGRPLARCMARLHQRGGYSNKRFERNTDLRVLWLPGFSLRTAKDFGRNTFLISASSLACTQIRTRFTSLLASAALSGLNELVRPSHRSGRKPWRASLGERGRSQKTESDLARRIYRHETPPLCRGGLLRR